MPSPIGHALAGVATAWAADLIPGRRRWRAAPSGASWYERAGDGFTLLCVVLAMAPDLDILWGGHREYTHSVGAVLFIALFFAALAANAGRPIARVTLMCAGAYATHLLLDWLGTDNYSPSGIRLMWPFTTRWYVSGWDVFPETARRFNAFESPMRQNTIAAVTELAIMVPIVVTLWLVRGKALAGLAPELPGRDHTAE